MMHPQLLDLLACPSCRSTLTLSARHGENLTCTGCSAEYPIVNGIPRFTSPSDSEAADEEDEVSGQFFTEFTAMEQGDRDLDPLPVREYYFFTRTGLDPRIYEALPGDPYRTQLPIDAYTPDGGGLIGQVVLDAGCGPGRFTEVAARYGAKFVVGLELGDHVDRAARRCASLPNVAFVQGSVLSPPFKPEAFDLAISIGVLHHTGQAEWAARQLALLVAPGGSMAVWVYPPEYWGRGPQRPISKLLHRIVARRDPAAGLRFCERWLYPLGRLQMKVHRKKIVRYLLAPLFLIKVPRHPAREVMVATIYDFYAPKHISTHTPLEVRNWLKTGGFQKVIELPVPSAAKGTNKRLNDSLATLPEP